MFRFINELKQLKINAWFHFILKHKNTQYTQVTCLSKNTLVLKCLTKMGPRIASLACQLAYAAAHYKSPHSHPDVLKSELRAKMWRYVSRIK